MKPTFSLSAADALPPIPPASRSAAAAAAKNVVLIVNLQSVGENQGPSAAPHRARSETAKSAVRHEHGSERRRGGRSAAARTRDQNQHDHGGKIGQGGHELRGNTDAGALGMQLQDGDRSEQIGVND